jgi:hypothetical protein
LSQKKKRFWIRNSLLQKEQKNKYLSWLYSHDYWIKQISILFKANWELIWTQYEWKFLWTSEEKNYDWTYEWDDSQKRYKLIIYKIILWKKSAEKYYAQEGNQNNLYIETIWRFKR